jgi:hypothetical protein
MSYSAGWHHRSDLIGKPEQDFGSVCFLLMLTSCCGAALRCAGWRMKFMKAEHDSDDEADSTKAASTKPAAAAVQKPAAAVAAAAVAVAQPDQAATVSSKPAAASAVHKVEPQINITHFTEDFSGATIVGRVIPLNGCCYVWVGQASSTEQGPLVTAVQTRYETMPIITELLGEVSTAALALPIAFSSICRHSCLALKLTLACQLHLSCHAGESSHDALLTHLECNAVLI